MSALSKSTIKTQVTAILAATALIKLEYAKSPLAAADCGRSSCERIEGELKSLIFQLDDVQNATTW